MQEYDQNVIDDYSPCSHPSEDKDSSAPNPNSNIIIIEQLSHAKRGLYLIYSLQDQEYYALKAFPYSKGVPSNSFRRASRFLALEHQNVVSFIDARAQNKSVSRGSLVDVSYILMEYAPFGDFHDIISTSPVPFTEKLIRSLFHQLVEGVEYLHTNGVAHLDLKLENLLLGEDFKLKITDFDDAYLDGDEEITSRGTKEYRAPEIAKGEIKNPFAADIFSLGIILFTLRSKGIFPFREEDLLAHLDIYATVEEDSSQFWELQAKRLKTSPENFSEEFRELFMMMTRVDPERRATLDDIKKSKWYNMPICSGEELIKVISGHLAE